MSNDLQIRICFSNALQSAIERHLAYEGGTEQLTFLFRLAVDYTFFVGTDTESVQELYENKIESRQDSLQLLDFLHGLVTQYAFNLALDDASMETVIDHLSLAIASARPLKPDQSLLPEHYVGSMSNKIDIANLLSNNAWFLALALLRYLAATDMIDTPIAAPQKPQERSV